MQSEAYAEFKKETRKQHKDEVDFYKEEMKAKKAALKSTVDKKKRCALPPSLVGTLRCLIDALSPEAEKALKEERNRYVEHLEHWVDQKLFRFGVEQAERKFIEEIFLAWSDSSLLKDLGIPPPSPPSTASHQSAIDMKTTIELHTLALSHIEQVFNARVEIENERHAQVMDPFSHSLVQLVTWCVGHGGLLRLASGHCAAHGQRARTRARPPSQAAAD